MNADPIKYEVDKESMGDALNYLEEGMPVGVVIYNDRPISIEIPQTVVREIHDHGNAATILLYDPRRKSVIFVRQFPWPSSSGRTASRSART